MIKVYGKEKDKIVTEGDINREIEYLATELNYIFFPDGIFIQIYFDKINQYWCISKKERHMFAPKASGETIRGELENSDVFIFYSECANIVCRWNYRRPLYFFKGL